MTRAVDTNTSEEQRSVYHLVCHDCPTESVIAGERVAQEQLEAHRAETGHNVELAPITAVEIE
ncbi:hypothetical protein [Halobellus sp. EA9]|uniref:hypothetical protein n=1 Tax=Halobellus sp. EA9 TaxID=3421647 RepID=UPI003EBE3086